MVFCLGFLSVTLTSAVFTVLVIIPDDFGLSGHPIGKHLSSAGAYVCCELGATLIRCRQFCFADQIILRVRQCIGQNRGSKNDKEYEEL